MMHFQSGDSWPWQRQQSPENLNSLRIKRVIRAYEKHGDRLIREFLLKDPSLSQLQNLFGESEQNGMVDSYPISSTQAGYFERQLQTTFDFDTLDYFLECDAV